MDLGAAGCAAEGTGTGEGFGGLGDYAPDQGPKNAADQSGVH